VTRMHWAAVIVLLATSGCASEPETWVGEYRLVDGPSGAPLLTLERQALEREPGPLSFEGQRLEQEYLVVTGTITDRAGRALPIRMYETHQNRLMADADLGDAGLVLPPSASSKLIPLEITGKTQLVLTSAGATHERLELRVTPSASVELAKVLRR
jgi:hypothetical protein